MADGVVGIKITGDSKDFEKSAQRAERATKRMGQEIADSGEKMRNFGVGAVAGGLLVAKGLGSAINAAADLGETTSKAEQLFGDATDDIIEFGEGAADSLGLSEQAAIDAASTFAIYGQKAGLAGNDLGDFSTELVTLATDMASFNNVGTEETIAAIGSALSGEAEPMKRFGVLLNEATLKAQAMKMGLIENANDAIPLQHKALVAHKEILEQTNVQQGDFARTQDGLPNKMKSTKAEMENMRAEIGERLLPVADKLVGAAGGMLDLFGKLPTPLQEVATYGAAAGSGIAIIGGSAAIGFGQIRKWRGELMQSGTTIKGLASSLKSNLNPAVIGGTLAIGAGLAIYGKWRQEQSRIATAAKETADAIAAGSDVVEEFQGDFDDVIDRSGDAEDGWRKIGLSVSDLTDLMDSHGSEMSTVSRRWTQASLDNGRYADRLRETGGEVDLFTANLLDAASEAGLSGSEIRGLMDAVSELGVRADESSAELEEQANNLLNSADAAKFTREEQELLNTVLEADSVSAQQAALLEFSEGNLEAASAAGVNTEALEANAEAADDLTDSTTDATDALKKHRDEVLGQFDPYLNYRNALQDVEDAQAKLDEVRREFGDDTPEQNRAILDQVAALSDLDGAMIELRTAFDNGTLSAEGMKATTDRWTESGYFATEQALGLETGIWRAQMQMNGWEAKDLLVHTWQAEQNLVRTRDYLNNIRGILDSISNSQGLVIRGGSGMAREMKADGGRVVAGRGYIVGERGPELFDPDVSGTIIPNHKLGYATAGNTMTAPSAAPVQITVNALDPRGAANAVMDAISQYERTNGTNWRN